MTKATKAISPTGSWGLYTRLSILAVVLTLFGVVTISIGVLVFGTGLMVGLAAWTICLIAALGAHVAGEYPKGDLYITARMALQMVVRTAPPFVFAVWALHFAAPPLEKSLVFYMILFYMTGLIADVQLTLCRLNAGR